MPHLTTRGLDLFYDEAGRGPPIVLGHSFLCSGAMWREQVPALASRYRVLNLDLRGHGRSGHLTTPFSLYDAVEDVIAVLDDLGIDRAIWCGLSIGGMVALRAALTHPDRVSALILCDSDAGAETAKGRLKYRAMGIGARVLGITPFLGTVTGLMFGATTRRERPALVREWRDRFAAVHVPSTLRCLHALLRRDSVVDRLGEIDVPALVLVGAEDRSLRPRLSERIARGLPHATLEIVPGAGHLSALEQPTLVTEAILRFLSARAV